MKKERDYSLIFLITISIILLIYSLVYLVNYYIHNDLLVHFPSNENLKKEKLNPNEIGDSIGGTLNPIIAFSAFILTFLAFYIQYKANNEQRQIFQQNSIKEKLIEHKNHKTNVKIFKILIKSMISYYKESGELLKKFINEESKNPLKMNVYSFVTNSSYNNLNKLDLKDIYASITYSFENKNIDWEKDFINTLTLIDFYDKIIKELKEKYNHHITSKSNNLNSVGEVLNKNIGDVLSDSYLKTFEGVDDYIAIVYNRDKSDNPIIEDDKFEGADFLKLQNIFFTKFLRRLKDEYDKKKDKKYKELLELYSFENKRIGTEKFQVNNYLENLQYKYSEYFEKENELNRIEDFLDKININ